MNRKNLFDLVVIGGGHSGIIAARAFQSIGLKICVIEKNKLDISSDDKDGRALAISRGSSKFLEEIGLWSSLEEYACPIKFIRALENGTNNVIDFDSNMIDVDQVGFILEAKNLNNTLKNYIKNNKNIDLKEQYTVIDINEEHDHTAITVQDLDGKEHRILAKLALVADGKFSSIRDKLGIHNKTLCYNQTAIIFTIKHSDHHNNVAIENFTHTGPFALLPIVGGYHSGVVWIEENPVADYIKTLSSADKLSLMKEKIGDYLGEIKIVSDVISYPLILKYTDQYSKGRSVLIGDSLHSIHPLAGQGLNLAIGDICALLSLVKEHNDAGVDIGSTILLEKFKRQRCLNNRLMIYFTHGINSLFLSKIPGVRSLRRFGLSLVNKLNPLKKFFMKKAMGNK